LIVSTYYFAFLVDRLFIIVEKIRMGETYMVNILALVIMIKPNFGRQYTTDSDLNYVGCVHEEKNNLPIESELKF